MIRYSTPARPTALPPAITKWLELLPSQTVTGSVCRLTLGCASLSGNLYILSDYVYILSDYVYILSDYVYILSDHVYILSDYVCILSILSSFSSTTGLCYFPLVSSSDDLSDLASSSVSTYVTYFVLDPEPTVNNANGEYVQGCCVVIASETLYSHSQALA